MEPQRRLLMIIGFFVAMGTVRAGLWLFTPAPDRGDFEVPGVIGEVEAPEVVVIFRGIEPRETFRLSPTEGARRSFRLTTWDESSSVTEGTTLARSSAEARIDVDGRVKEVRDDGAFEWRWEVDAVEVVHFEAEGEMADKGQGFAIEELEGLEGTAVVDNQGYVLRSSLDGGGKNAPKELRQHVARVLSEPSPHLPDEPIGERAIWEVRRVEQVQGVATAIVQRFELMKASGDRIELREKTSATAERQTITTLAAFGMEVLSADVIEFAAKGSGDWVFELDGALAWRGEGWSEQATDLELAFSGLPIVLHVLVKTEVALDPLP